MTGEEFDQLADGAWKYEIEALRQQLAEAQKLIGSYKTLTKALEEQVSHHRRLSERYQESIKTMQSERDANAILTCELAEAQKDAERYRFVRIEWFKENDSWLMSNECAFLDTPEEMDAAIDKEMRSVE